MTCIFTERSEEKRSIGQALLREADNFGRLPSFLLNPSQLRRLGFCFLCYSGMLLLARVIGWINVSYREWPPALNLNDGRSACPTVMVHFGRCFAESARRQLDCFCLIEFVAHSDVKVA
jgi:hypothetical protein